VTHYFVVYTWELPPKIYLIRRNSEDAEELAEIEMPDLAKEVKGSTEITFRDCKKGRTYTAEHGLTERQRRIILAGGLLNYAGGK